MNLNQFIQHKTLPSLGLLAFRVVIGSAFIFHGLPKAQNAFNWMGDSMPGILQAFAAYSEVLGGLALLLGFLTPLASLALIGTMLGALGLVHIPAGDPFVAMEPGKGSQELALVYLSGAVLFLFNSAGKFSVDYLIAKALDAKSNAPKLVS